MTAPNAPAPLRRHLATVREATAFSAARPAWAAGLRAAVATVAPLVIATMVGSTSGTWLSLGGFNAALADKGGSYRTRALTIAAVTAGTAIAILLGTLGGTHLAIAVPLTFLAAFVGCLARAWGNAGVSIGGATLSTFVIALAYPSASPSHALMRAAFGFAGGLGAMALALVLWPLRPYRPAREAVSHSYLTLAVFLHDIVRALRATPADARTHEAPAGSALVRAAFEQSRAVLAQVRRGRPGSSGRGEQLIVLGEAADQIFGHLVGAAESVESVPVGLRDAAALLVVAETISMAEATVRAIGRSVDVETTVTEIPLGWNGDALRGVVSRLEAGSEAALHYLHAAAILDRAARFASAAAEAADALHRGQKTAPVPVRPDFTPPTDSPFILVRAILAPESVILRYALRVAVVTTVAVLITSLLDLHYGYWITITVIVIMQPYTGATTHRALQRVIGTVLGAIITAALGAMFHDPRAVLVLSFIFAGMCVALMPVNYAAYSVFLTPTFVLLAEANAGDWHLAHLRVMNTLLGGALALGGSRLLWPSPEWTRLPGYMARALRANADYLGRVTELFADRSDAAGRQLRDARRDIGLASVNAEESFQRLMGEHRGAPESLAPAMSFLTYTRRFAASVAALALARHAAPPEAAASLVPFTEAARAVFEDLASAVSEGRRPAPLPPLAAVDEAEASVPPLLLARVDRLASQVHMLHQSVDRWMASAER